MVQVRFGQINLGKRIDAVTELIKRNYDVALVTEPQTTKGKVAGLDSAGKTVVADVKKQPQGVSNHQPSVLET